MIQFKSTTCPDTRSQTGDTDMEKGRGKAGMREGGEGRKGMGTEGRRERGRGGERKGARQEGEEAGE